MECYNIYWFVILFPKTIETTLLYITSYNILHQGLNILVIKLVCANCLSYKLVKNIFHLTKHLTNLQACHIFTKNM